MLSAPFEECNVESLFGNKAVWMKLVDHGVTFEVGWADSFDARYCQYLEVFSLGSGLIRKMPTVSCFSINSAGGVWS